MATGYPDGLNPFGDDPQATPHTQTTHTTNRINKQHYPEQLNPFDVEDELATNDDDDYDNSFNPFATDDNQHSKTTPQIDPSSRIDYDETLNPFDEGEEDVDNNQRVDNSFDNRKTGQYSRYSSGYSSSILPVTTNKNNDDHPQLIKSPASQPHLSVTNPSHPRRLSPGKRHKKRAAPKPPTEQSPVGQQQDGRLSSLTSPEVDEKPMQYSMTSSSDLENPSLSYSSIQSISSLSSPVVQEQAQQVPSADHNDDAMINEELESSDKTLTASNGQLSQPAATTTSSSGYHPDLPTKPSPLRVPSPAIRRSLNSMSSINHSSSSISSQKEQSSTTCRSHDGSMTNISDDTRPKPLPRTKSLLKKEGRLPTDVVPSPSHNLKEKLENLETEPKNSEDSANIPSDEKLSFHGVVETQKDHTNIEDIESNTTQDQSVKLESEDAEASSSGEIDEPAIVNETIIHSGSNTEEGSLLVNNQDSRGSNMNQKENQIDDSVESIEGHDDDRNAALWRKIGLKKRAAPPLPVNFKRQVFGSLVEIEAELNEIGDKLVDNERQFIACKAQMIEERSKTNDTTISDSVDTQTLNRLKFIELVKEKCDLARRQKDLMYRKREHILDQSHSDIEYELRMIGNKQSSHRTDQDDQREQELLKRLVEIIEEKNDIVENLIKDNSISDEDELNEALKRLDIKSPTSESFLGQSTISAKDCDRKTAAFNRSQASPNASISKQDKTKTKHRPSTAKALKTLKKYGKVVVKMSKKDNDNEPKSSVTKTPL